MTTIDDNTNKDQLSPRTRYTKKSDHDQLIQHSDQEGAPLAVDSASILDQLPGVVITTDLEGSIYGWNQAAENQFSYQVHEIRGKNIAVLLADNIHADKPDKLVQRLRNDGGFQQDIAVRDKDGKVFNVTACLSLLQDGSGQAAGFVYVMTQHKLQQILPGYSQEITNFIDAGILGMAIVEPGTFRFLQVNDSYCDMVGYSREEMLKMTIFDLSHPDDIDDTEETLNGILSGHQVQDSYTLNKRHIRKDGEVIYVTVLAKFLRDEYGNVKSLIGFIQDITDKRIAEQARLKSERHLRQAQHIAYFGSWEFNYRTETITISDEIYEMYDISKGEFNHTLNELIQRIHPDDRDKTNQIRELAKSGNEAFNVQYRIIRSSGEIRYLHSQATLIIDPEDASRRLVGAVMDITEAKLAEQQIERYKHIVDTTTDYISFVDRNYVYQAVNRQYELSFDLSREEILGKRIDELLGEEVFKERLQENLEKALAGKAVNFQVWIQTRNFGECYVDTHYYPFRDEDGKIIGIVINARDITESKRSQIALEQSEAKLKEAQRIAHLGSYEHDLVIGEVFWSDELYAICGLEPDTFTPSSGNYKETIHPEDLETVLSQVDKTIEERGFCELTYRIIRPDGEVRHVQDRAKIIYNNQGEPEKLLGSILDITDSKLAEEQLRKSEANLREAQQIARLGFVDVDLVTNKRTWSEELYNIFGINSEDFDPVNTTLMDLAHTEDRELIQSARDAILKDDTPFDIEYRILRDDEVRYVHSRSNVIRNDEGEPIKLMGTVMDITDRKLAQQQLERYKHIIDTTGEFVSFIDKDYVYQAVNKQYLHGFEKDAEDIVGHSVPELFGQDLFENRVKYYLDKALSGETPNSKDWHDIPRYGRRCMDTTYYPFRGDSGEITGVVVSSRDITESKRAEQEITRYKHIVDATGDYISFVDKDYVYRAVNRKYLEAFNRKWEDIVGYPVKNFVGMQHFNDNIKPVLDKALAGEQQNYQSWMEIPNEGYCCIDGYFYPYREEDGTISGVVVSGRDVTESKLAQSQIEKYKHIVDSTDDYVAFVDPDYVYQAINKKYLESFGKPAHEIIGHSVPDLHKSEWFERNTQPYLDKALAGETQHSQMWEDVPHLGRRYIDASYYPYREEDGAISGVVVSTRDMTDKKLVEEQITRYKHIVDSTDDYVSFIDKNYVYQAVNRQYLSAFQKTWGELIGHTVEELHGKEVFERTLKHNLDSAFKGRRQKYRFWVEIPRDGQRYIESNLYPYRGEDGEISGAVVLTRDITDARLAEEQIERYKHIVDATDDYISFVDRDFIYRAVNKQYLGAFGKEWDDIVGHPAAELHDENEYEINIKPFLVKALAGESQNNQFWINISNYGKRFIDSNYFPYREESGDITGVVVSTRDITEAKLAESQIQQYKHIVDSTDDYICFIDRDYIYRAVNKNYIQRFEKTRAEIVGEHVATLHGREYFENKIKNDIDRALSGEILNYQTWLPTPKGQRYFERNYYPYRDNTGVITGVVLTTQDITERQRAEEVLQQYKHIVDTSNDMMALLDRSNVYRAVNKKYLEAYNKTWDEVVGHHIADITGRSFYEEFAKEHFARTLKGESFNTQVWRDYPGYGKVYTDITYMPYRLADGTIDGIVLSIHDITELKKTQDELEKRQVQLREAQRIGQLGFFDHDLSTGEMFWSDEHYNIFGVDTGTFQPSMRSVISLIHPDDRESVRKVVETAIHTFKLQNNVHRIITPDGETRYIQIQGEVIADEEGKAAHIIGTALNVTEQKQVEEELRQSQAQLLEAQRIAHLGFWWTEYTSEGEKVLWSDEVYDIYGIKPEDYSGSYEDRLKVIHPDDQDYVANTVMNTVKVGDTFDIEYRAVRPNGEIRYINARGEVIQEADDSGKQIKRFGTVMDITQQKRVEEELRQSQAQLLEAQRIAHLGFWWTEMTDQGERIFWSDEVYNIYGIPPGTFIGKRAEQIRRTHPEDRKLVLEKILENVNEGDEFDIEYRIIRPDGEIRFIHVRGEVVEAAEGSGGFIRRFGTIMDITEQERVEEALRMGEERLRRYFDAGLVGMVIIGTNKEFLQVNDTYCEMTGYSREELLTMTLEDVSHPDDMQESEEQLQKTFRGEQEGFALEKRYLRKDGEVIYVAVSSASVRDDDDSIEYLVSFIEDITERKRAEKELDKYRDQLEDLVVERTEELKVAQEELIRKERLAVLGQLTATVSHELRNPLGTIRSTLYTVGNKIRKHSDLNLDKALNRAQRNITRCDNIIEELLDYTRTHPIQLKENNIDQWCQEVLTDFQFPQDIAVKTSLCSGATIPFEKDRLHRCMINILSNACQAMTQEEEGFEQKNKQLTIETAIEGERLEIRITDTGPGIPEDKMEKIFEPLYSTKIYGVGLGLPIVKQIMEQHRGGVIFRSQQGQGTSVTLWLPLQQQDQDIKGAAA